MNISDKIARDSTTVFHMSTTAAEPQLSTVGAGNAWNQNIVIVGEDKGTVRTIALSPSNFNDGDWFTVFRNTDDVVQFTTNGGEFLHEIDPPILGFKYSACTVVFIQPNSFIFLGL